MTSFVGSKFYFEAFVDLGYVLFRELRSFDGVWEIIYKIKKSYDDKMK